MTLALLSQPLGFVLLGIPFRHRPGEGRSVGVCRALSMREIITQGAQVRFDARKTIRRCPEGYRLCFQRLDFRHESSEAVDLCLQGDNLRLKRSEFVHTTVEWSGFLLKG